MKVLSFMFVLFLCFNADASGTVKTKIKSLWVNDLGADVVYLEPETPFQSVCNSNGSKYFIIHLDRKNMSEVYSMALAAYMSDMEVNVGGKNECSGTNEVLRYMYLKR
ncbi:hypothetical protein CWC22_010640 [Pseudoalteromonas rubra]|uniref:Uncharacterized protein n=1 Tax=Pseudoalteromonas rubra TaxID=43658 RepID=A0A5S3UQ94_9GAMM|nr:MULTISPECIES: hypothetical protein [Pseudoalteromonas]MEC4091917.1 hypothetical protein [Pseudoalteromonas rubra]QPB83416.1 hypothetical protein CWC22_010640 [Pseudoalteromonas rubra]